MIDHKQRYSDTAHTKHSQPQPHHNFKYNTRLRRLSALRGGRPAEVSRGQQMLTQPSLLLLSVHRDDRCSRRWPHGRSRGRTIGWNQPRTIIILPQEQVGLNWDLRSYSIAQHGSRATSLAEDGFWCWRELRVLHRSHRVSANVFYYATTSDVGGEGRLVRRCGDNKPRCNIPCSARAACSPTPRRQPRTPLPTLAPKEFITGASQSNRILSFESIPPWAFCLTAGMEQGQEMFDDARILFPCPKGVNR